MVARDINGTTSNIANVPVAVASHGSAASWAYDSAGVQIADTSASNADEDLNGDYAVGTTFYTRDATKSTAATGGEFDDLVVWIPTSLYVNRMISAAQLP